VPAAQVKVKVPFHVRGPFNATGAGRWLGTGPFNDAQLAKIGRALVTNIRITAAKTGGGVSSLQVMYDKTWGPQRGASRATDATHSFSPPFDAKKEYITAAFAKPGAGIMLDDVRFVTNRNRSIGGALAKAAELQPLHPCPNWAPGRFRLAYVSGNAATAQQDIAKTSKHLFSLSLYWVDTAVPVPVGDSHKLLPWAKPALTPLLPRALNSTAQQLKSMPSSCVCVCVARAGQRGPGASAAGRQEAGLPCITATAQPAQAATASTSSAAVTATAAAASAAVTATTAAASAAVTATTAAASAAQSPAAQSPAG
jgi:hypothetical protein